MARLDLEAAPPTALPRAALAMALLWGLVAGGVLVLDGPAATLSRWGPATLALVHALTVGLFGNAATGALLQFLPAAAGVRPWGGPGMGIALLVTLNLGAGALVAGFRSMQPAQLLAGGALVATAVASLAASSLPGLLRTGPRAVLQVGLAAAVLAWVATVGLGLAMLRALVGSAGLAPVQWIDVHAMTGLAGAMLLLVAAVAQQVLPMFQGVDPMTPRRLAAWLAAMVLTLLAVAGTRGAIPARLLLTAVVATWMLSTLWRQARGRRHRRNPVLVWAWRGGCIAALAALAAGFAADARLAGAVALAVALPLFLVPMLLEITAFLGWLGLFRAVGGRVPGVHALQPERDKAVVVALQVFAGLGLVAAVGWPDAAAARSAGVALLLAHGAGLVALLRLERRCRLALRAARA